jgi:hypothetical protein
MYTIIFIYVLGFFLNAMLLSNVINKSNVFYKNINITKDRKVFYFSSWIGVLIIFLCLYKKIEKDNEF